MATITMIIKKTYADDMYGSSTTDIKVCESVEAAKASILAEANKSFETECKSLDELVTELDGDIEECGSKHHDSGCPFDFYWFDDGKGEEFTIAEVETDGEYYNVLTEGYE